jgi:pilus assembly protein CpaB
MGHFVSEGFAPMKQKNVILMVVAVGCGLVAAFLTSQMASKPVEQVEVVVAANDLSVGTVFTKETLDKSVKLKKVPKDALPPVFLTNKEDLLDKRLSRPMRAEDTINPNDLNKGITLPDGHDLVSLAIGASSAASGFVIPGSRVDVMASLKLDGTLRVFDLLVNTLVVNVNHDMANAKNGVYADLNQVGFALTAKQSKVLELARARGCNLSLRLRNDKKGPEADKDYKIDDVIKMLETAKNPAEFDNTNDPPVKPKTQDPTPPTAETVKVLVANRAIAPNTDITKDLIEEAFTLKEFPKGTTGHAIADLTPALLKAFPQGVPAGVWVTPEMIGQKTLPSSPRDYFEAKPGAVEPPVANPMATPNTPEPTRPVAPPEPPQPAKAKYVHVAVHTASGTIIYRYEKVGDELRAVGPVTEAQVAEYEKTEKTEAPKKVPDTRKVD